jgi:hypothetical protein
MSDPLEGKFVRTCQECGHRQEARDPKMYKGESWRDLKCKKCKSEALDYGSWKSTAVERALYEKQCDEMEEQS